MTNVIGLGILAIEAHSKGLRQPQCPACHCWHDNTVRHAEQCAALKLRVATTPPAHSHVYSCKRHGIVTLSMAPSDARAAAGTPVTCAQCGEVLYYKGIGAVEPQSR